MPLQKRVSELPAVPNVAATDLLIVSSANATKRCTVQQIGAYFQANGVAGPSGPAGAAGAAATISVGTVSTGAPGSSATVVNAGSSSAAVLNFTIPAGTTGATGPQGPQGPAGTTTWAGITDKPTTFPPSAHQHVAADISDFTTAVIAAAPPTTNASLLTSGTLPDARLSANIARTSDVSSAVAALVNSAPAALDTLGELATALGSDANFSTTVTNALASKAPINNPTFTGTVSGITKGMVGLGNVDNTSDANKPISAATQAALDGKAASSHAHGSITSDGKIGSVAGKAVVTGEAGVLQASDYVANALYLYDTTDDNGPMFAIQDTDPYWSPTAIEAGTPGKLRVSIGASAVGHAHSAADISDFASAVAAASPEEVVEYTTTALFPASGNSTLLYIATDASRAYRWTGAAYVEVGPLASYVSVTYGTTSGTACQGNDSRLSDARTPTGAAGGDLTGNFPNATLAASGVTAGTYTSVTVDAKGRVTAGSNPSSGGVKLGLILALQ